MNAAQFGTNPFQALSGNNESGSATTPATGENAAPLPNPWGGSAGTWFRQLVEFLVSSVIFVDDFLSSNGEFDRVLPFRRHDDFRRHRHDEHAVRCRREVGPAHGELDVLLSRDAVADEPDDGKPQPHAEHDERALHPGHVPTDGVQPRHGLEHYLLEPPLRRKPPTSSRNWDDYHLFDLLINSFSPLGANA